MLAALGTAVAAAAALYFYGHPRRVTLANAETDMAVMVYKLKAPSMKAWENANIAGTKVSAFSYERLAMTVKGPKKITIRDSGIGGPVQISVEMQGTSGLGAATVISHDGYLLTAAHCIDGEPISVVIKRKGRKFEEVSARVVWKGKASTKLEPDLALLHVDRVFPSVFVLGDESGLSLRSPVFASGYCQFEEATCAGSITRAPTSHANDSGIKWTIFYHDAPNAPGDSGGPVFGREGQLLGISVQGNATAWFWRGKPISWYHHSICHRPDMDWLKELMAKDRQAQQQAGKAAGEGKS